MKERCEASVPDLLGWIIRMVYKINELPDQYVCLDYNGGIGFVQVYSATTVEFVDLRKTFAVSGGVREIGKAYNCDVAQLWNVLDNLNSYAESVGISKLEIDNDGF